MVKESRIHSNGSRPQALASKRAVTNEPTENVIGESWDLLASERNVRFNERGISPPRGARARGAEEVRHYIETKRLDVFFSFEARQTKVMMLSITVQRRQSDFGGCSLLSQRCLRLPIHRCRADFPEIRWQAHWGNQQHDGASTRQDQIRKICRAAPRADLRAATQRLSIGPV